MRKNKLLENVKWLALILIAVFATHFSSAVLAANSDEGSMSIMDSTGWSITDPDQLKTMHEEYEAEVAYILAGIKDTWTDAEKLLYLHDYLCSHATFDENGFENDTSMSKTAYNALVKHSAVSEGLARAFYDLANRVGIKTDIVSGKKDKYGDVVPHTWNLVVLDGKGYYIDVSEDEGNEMGDTGSNIMHRFFLKSQSYLVGNDYLDDGGWLINKAGTDENIFGKYDNTDYDEIGLNDSYHPAMNIDDYWLYYTEGSTIYKMSGDLKNSTVFQECSENFQITDVEGCIFAIEISTLSDLDDDDYGIFKYDVSTKSFTEVYSLETGKTDFSVALDLYDSLAQYYIWSPDDSWDAFTIDVELRDFIEEEIESVSLDKKYYRFDETGKNVKLTATVETDLTDGCEVTWSSSNPNVATVDNEGNVTAVGYGMANIKASVSDKYAACAIVIPKLEFTENEMELEPGDKATIEIYMFGNAVLNQYKTLNWSSSDSNVVTLSESTSASSWDNFERDLLTNNITAVAPGEAIVTASTADNRLVASIKIIVKGTQQSVSVAQVVITYDGEEKSELTVGESLKLFATPTPANADGDLSVRWSTSDETIASVDEDGNVTGLKVGFVTITAQIQDKTNSVRLYILNNDGMHQDENGVWHVYRDGVIDTSFSGLYDTWNEATKQNEQWLFLNGTFASDYNDLYFASENKAYEIKKGIRDISHTGLYLSKNYGWYLLNNGCVDFGYNDLFLDETFGWWKVRLGKVDFEFTGLYNSPACGWWLIDQGRLASEYSGLYNDAQYGWWLIDKGRLAFEYNGLYNDPVYGWWLIDQGQLATYYTELYHDFNLGWWKVIGGAVDLAYTGLYNSENYGWWLINSGRVDLEYNDLWGDPVYGWWLIKGGAVDFGYTGLYGSESYGWWLISGGTVAFGYNDLWGDPKYGWWKVNNGYVDFGYTGLYNSESCGWWLVGAGEVAFYYEGTWNDTKYGEWEVSGGSVVF